MKKFSIATALLLALVCGFWANSVAADSATLTASASCNGKWVIVTVDAPDTATILATWGGKTVAVGNKFVPDTGGANPTGDYGLTIALESRAWVGSENGHYATTKATVTTPTCTPLVTQEAAPTPPVVETQVTAPTAKQATVPPTYDVWADIVQAISIIL
jgi:hypothetical protein